MASVDRIINEAHNVLSGQLAVEIALTYGDQVVFPTTVQIDEVASPRRLFPGWREDVLVISIENQDVCAWGISLGGQRVGAVVVGGDRTRLTFWCGTR